MLYVSIIFFNCAHFHAIFTIYSIFLSTLFISNSHYITGNIVVYYIIVIHYNK